MTSVHYARCRTNCEHAAAANAITVQPHADGYAVMDGSDVYTWHREDNAEYHADMLRMRICKAHSSHDCDCADVAARRSWTIVRDDAGIPVRLET